MSNALDNLRSKFKQISEIKSLLETHNLYIEYMSVAPEHVSYIIPIEHLHFKDGLVAVHEGKDELLGTENEMKFHCGLCIVGLQSGVEFVAGQLPEAVREQVERCRVQGGDGKMINLNILGLASPKNG